MSQPRGPQDERSALAIDGSYREGGGQILRTAVALSAVTGRAVEILNIRAGRPTPGLRPQHVTAVRLVAEICGAKIENAAVGATSLRFTPGPVRTTHARADVGTAGSITLILQAVIPALALGRAAGELDLRGGTDVPWSPTMDYFRYVVLPAFAQLGVGAQIEVRRRGFYPAGGGEVHLSVTPAGTLGAIEWLDAVRVPPVLRSLAARLPRSVAERQLRAAESYLQAHQMPCAGSEVAVEDAASPGTAIGVYAVGPEGPFLGADGLGERGVPAERVGRSAAERFVREAHAGVPVDHHLADMLVTLLPFAAGESRFRTPTVTPHLETNLYVAAQLTGCQYAIDHLPGGAAEVRVMPVKQFTRNA